MASTSAAAANGESIKVYARLRPSAPQHKTNEDAATCVKMDPTTSTITIENGGNNRQFQVNKVFGPSSTQESVFRDVGRSIIDGFLEGINGTIFAYGQTGSGKTFTMLGMEAANESNRGVIPRSIEDIFAALQSKQSKNADSFKYTIKCSFLELYNEKLYDLLLFNKNALIKVQQIRDQIKIVGAKEIEVKTAEDCMKYLWKGWNQRKVAETSMNHESSRSHAIFRLELVTQTSNGTVMNRRASRLNMVDLAGSERQTQTNNVGSRLREAGNINNSLSILARVIRSLASSSTQKQPQHVSYRDSILTQLLRDSLGGSSRTTVIVNIHPNVQFVADTTSTLSFAEAVQKVKNVATENSNLTYFQKLNNTLDERQKKTRELEEQSVDLRKDGLAHLLQMLNSVKAADDQDYHEE